ncbi:hypothetical protein BJV78DRAFT_93139 [Lactifluus subvellereus]|nr:hypothetical protein BJV78DRAFT_93139 [Lactifluus subvellereus]
MIQEKNGEKKTKAIMTGRTLFLRRYSTNTTPLPFFDTLRVLACRAYLAFKYPHTSTCKVYATYAPICLLRLRLGHFSSADVVRSGLTFPFIHLLQSPLVSTPLWVTAKPAAIQSVPPSRSRHSLVTFGPLRFSHCFMPPQSSLLLADGQIRCQLPPVD